nr:helix-turn-helix domain-containing protein [Shinella zoogloeoides]
MPNPTRRLGVTPQVARRIVTELGPREVTGRWFRACSKPI